MHLAVSTAANVAQLKPLSQQHLEPRLLRSLGREQCLWAKKTAGIISLLI